MWTSTRIKLASTNHADPGTCGETALTAAKVFVAAVQAGDPSTYERCERTHSLLSADDINSVASGAWVVDNAFVTTQIDPPPAANETVIQIPAPPVPRESQPPQDSGIDIRIATGSIRLLRRERDVLFKYLSDAANAAHVGHRVRFTLSWRDPELLSTDRDVRRSGRSGIRTHGGPKTSTAFEAVPFVRSGILPADEPSRAP